MSTEVGLQQIRLSQINKTGCLVSLWDRISLMQANKQQYNQKYCASSRGQQQTPGGGADLKQMDVISIQASQTWSYGALNISGRASIANKYS